MILIYQLLNSKLNFIKEVSILTIEKFIALPITFIVSALIARSLGPENYGSFVFAQAILTLLTGISSFGVSNYLTNELAIENFKHNKILSSLISIRFLFSILLIILILFYSFFISDIQAANSLRLLIIALLFSSFDFLNVYLLYKKQVLKSALSRFIPLIISIFIKLIFIYFEFTVLYFIVAQLIQLSLCAIFYFINTKHLKLSFKLNYEVLILFLKNGWPFFISIIVISIFMRIDQIFIQNYLGSTSNGIYAAGTRLSELWYYIPTVLISLIFPRMAKIYDTNKINYKSYFLFVLLFMILLSILILILTSLFGFTLINSIYGSEYSSSAHILLIHIWTVPFVFLGLVFNMHIIKKNLQVYETICLTAGAISNIVLNFILIEKYALLGVAFATVAAQFISNLVFPLLLAPLRKEYYYLIKDIKYVRNFRNN
tara:strand:- start:12832 stop:14124 length:1293 start_codon:yes stop_codon:yes gene_type:complete